MHQYAKLGEIVYFYFPSNNTSGSGADGANSAVDVREAGQAASAVPILSGPATLLTHANFPPGCYEVGVPATAGNGFAANKTYGVFATLLVDSTNPTGFIGSFRLAPVPADVGVVPTAVENRQEMDSNSTQLAKLGAPAGANMSADIAALKTVADAIDILTKAAGDGDLAAMKTAIDLIKGVTDAQDKVVISGTAQTGILSTTQMTTDLTITVTDQLNDRVLTFDKDTTTTALRGQQTDIIAAVAAGGLLTMAALTTAPAAGDLFKIT